MRVSFRAVKECGSLELISVSQIKGYAKVRDMGIADCVGDSGDTEEMGRMV